MSMLSRFATLGGAPGDPYFSSVSLLLNGDGANGSTVFKDLSSTPKTITAYGNAQISTAQKKFGTGSMYFNGTGSYLTMPYNSAFDFETGDFTVEAWVNGTYASDTFIFSSSTNNGFFFGFTGANVGIGRVNVAWDTLYTHNATANTWNHFAISRYNSTTYVFVNGVLKGSATNGQNYSAQNSIMYVGTQSVMYLTGYVDDLRITKGLARYTQNFTPPTAAMPTY